MREKSLIKFNLYMSCVLLAILVLVFVGATVAYFSATKQTEAVFTAGNVEIALSEAAIQKADDGNLVEDPSKPRLHATDDGTVINDYGRVYPGMSIFKDPTVTNTGYEAEWIAAKVTITDGTGDIARLIGYPGFEGIDIRMLLTGGLLDETVHFDTWNEIPEVSFNDHFAMIQVPNAQEGVYTFYFLILQPVDSGQSVMLFNQLHLPKEWGKTEMDQLSGLKIHVQAYGVQLFQLNSCLDAMKAAFPEQFVFE